MYLKSDIILRSHFSCNLKNKLRTSIHTVFLSIRQYQFLLLISRFEQTFDKLHLLAMTRTLLGKLYNTQIVKSGETVDYALRLVKKVRVEKAK